METNISEYKKSLELEQYEILNRVKSLASDKMRQKEALTKKIDDQAQIVENDEVVDGLEDLERLKLKSIKEALKRIDAGIYGICANCEEEIPASRLNAMPSAITCVKCSH